MSWGLVVGAVVSGAVGMYSAKQNRDIAEDAAEEANKKQLAEQAKLEAEKTKYKQMKFSNPYANLENPYEDLTVNQQQAMFEAEQGAQQRANIMQSFKAAAGGSGIAALAQTLANQGQLQAQRISASIGQQEAAAQRLKAKGAFETDVLEREGEKMKQQFEIDKQTTLLGMQMGAATGANLAQQQASIFALESQMAQNTATAEAMGGIAGAAATAIGKMKDSPDDDDDDKEEEEGG
jgi:hypothetical protein